MYYYAVLDQKLYSEWNATNQIATENHEEDCSMSMTTMFILYCMLLKAPRLLMPQWLNITQSNGAFSNENSKKFALQLSNSIFQSYFS